MSVIKKRVEYDVQSVIIIRTYDQLTFEQIKVHLFIPYVNVSLL